MTHLERLHTLPDDVRDKALVNSAKQFGSSPGWLGCESLSLCCTLVGAFSWNSSPEGNEYWNKIAEPETSIEFENRDALLIALCEKTFGAKPSFKS